MGWGKVCLECSMNIMSCETSDAFLTHALAVITSRPQQTRSGGSSLSRSSWPRRKSRAGSKAAARGRRRARRARSNAHSRRQAQMGLGWTLCWVARGHLAAGLLSAKRLSEQATIARMYDSWIEVTAGAICRGDGQNEPPIAEPTLARRLTLIYRSVSPHWAGRASLNTLVSGHGPAV